MLFARAALLVQRDIDSMDLAIRRRTKEMSPTLW
jgi:hypothetical protein